MAEATGIRSYRAADRPAVREIACDTADIGAPVERLFRDREAAAEILVGYYTDRHPELIWVAERDGRVVGYLTGCLDTSGYRRAMRTIAARALVAAARRGAFGQARTWHLLAAMIGTAVLGGGRPERDLARYPAHFHINLRPEARGMGLGRRLVAAFCRRAEAAGVTGIQVAVRGDNTGGRRFFEAMGFALLREWPLLLPEGRWFRRTSTAVYGWRGEA